MNRKRVVILGATGSIGESALKVARDIPDRMEIVGLAAKSNAQKLAAAANEVRPTEAAAGFMIAMNAGFFDRLELSPGWQAVAELPRPPAASS